MTTALLSRETISPFGPLMFGTGRKRLAAQLKEAEAQAQDKAQEAELLAAEREQLRGRLEQAQLSFRQLMNASFDGVCVIEHSIIAEVNAQLAAIFGKSAAELKGRHVLDLCAPEQRGALRKAVKDGLAEPLEVWGMHASGE